MMVARINVLGAGPAGLYVAILMKRADPRREILVVERGGCEPAITDEILDVMRRADYASYRAIATGGSALLDVLRHRCAELGIEVADENEVVDPAALADADLLVVERGWAGAELGGNVVPVGDMIEDAIAVAGAFARRRDEAAAMGRPASAELAGSAQ